MAPATEGVIGSRASSQIADPVQLVHRDLRGTIREAMQEAAAGAGISIMSRASDEPVESIEVFVKKEPSGTTWRNRTRLALITLPIPVADTLSIQQMEKGVDLLFTFLLLPDGSELPSDFYIVSFSRNPRNRDAWTARFRNLSGRVVLQKPAVRMETTGSQSPKGGATATVRFDRRHPPTEGNAYVCQVGHFSPLRVVTSFEVQEGEARPVSRPEAAAKIVRAIGNYAAAVSGLLEEASGRYGKAHVDEWLSLTMGDAVFAIFTAFAEVERYSLEDVAKGRDVLFGYFPPLILKGVRTTEGFKKVHLLLEAGQWKLRFYEIAPGTGVERLAGEKIRGLDLQRESGREVAGGKVRPPQVFGGIVFHDELGPSFELGFRWSDAGQIRGAINTNKGAFVINPKMDSG